MTPTKNLMRKIVFVAAISFMAGCSVQPNGSVHDQSVYDRVMKSGTIRCGYTIYPPYCMKDPNTGKLSGISIDILEVAGKNLGLKIDWAEEVGWGTIIEGLETNRYDLVPTGVWPNANRGKHASFSIPISYSGLEVYVRPDDSRFTNNLQAINSDAVTIATTDGCRVLDIAKNRFPHAHRLTHPDMTDESQLLLDVANHKADVTFADPTTVARFLKNNPGQIKSITTKPIEIEPNTMMFKIGEPAFKSVLDTALTELINNGYVDQVLNKYVYEPKRGVYYRLAAPYQTTCGSPIIRRSELS